MVYGSDMACMQLHDESGCSCFFIQDLEDDNMDEDADCLIPTCCVEFSEIPELSYRFKPQDVTVAYLLDIFWLGKNKYL